MMLSASVREATGSCGQLSTQRLRTGQSAKSKLTLFSWLCDNPLSIPACAGNPNSTQCVARRPNKLAKGMGMAEGFVGRRKAFS